MSKTAAIDAIKVAVIANALDAITKEMGETMLRTSRSPIFSEARDFVTAIFDREARLVAQTHYIPVIGGSTPFAMKAIAQRAGTDVNEGDGGLCVIPGSHKANFPLPQKICHWQEHRGVVYNVPCKTGDMVIFNEATLHGTLPWTAEHERRSLLYRYSPKYLHFAGGTYQTSQPAWVSELTEAQQAVLEPPYIYNRPLVEADGETVVRPRTG